MRSCPEQGSAWAEYGEWYDSDGIDFIRSGEVESARRIASAVVVAFLASGEYAHEGLAVSVGGC